jgi:hypothetical protein
VSFAGSVFWLICSCSIPATGALFAADGPDDAQPQLITASTIKNEMLHSMGFIFPSLSRLKLNPLRPESKPGHASALSGWNGGVTEEFRKQLRALRGLCQDTVELRRGDHSGAHCNWSKNGWDGSVKKPRRKLSPISSAG